MAKSRKVVGRKKIRRMWTGGYCNDISRQNCRKVVDRWRSRKVVGRKKYGRPWVIGLRKVIGRWKVSKNLVKLKFRKPVGSKKKKWKDMFRRSSLERWLDKIFKNVGRQNLRKFSVGKKNHTNVKRSSS